MEVDITAFVRDACARDYSASAAELGNDAGRITWDAAKDDVEDWLPRFSADQLDVIADYFAGFGAWENAELAQMTGTELAALLLQFIAGDVREFQEVANSNWDEYSALCNSGTVSGRMYRGDDGRIYYYVGD